MLSFIKKINFSQAFYRFPVSSALSVAVTLLACYMIYSDGVAEETNAFVLRLIITGSLVYLASIVIRIAKEAYALKNTYLYGLWLLTLVLAVIVYNFLPENFELYNTRTFRLPYILAGLYAILHLLISFIPYLYLKSDEDFWEFNQRLFFLYVQSAFFSLFLFATLSFALVALDKLFDVPVNADTYQYLFVLLAGIFHSFYILSKFPAISFDGGVEVPSKLFLVFVQYILIPVSLIYGLILHAYAFKILFSGVLPKGWVGQLCLWFSIISIFTFLLNRFADRFGAKIWTTWYQRYFFAMLIIPTILMLISTYKRISDYGVTEARYALAMIGVWLVVLFLSFGVYKRLPIKWIPISLSAFILFACFSGPLSMFDVTTRSQIKRTQDMLITSGWIKDDKIVPYPEESKKQDVLLSDQLTFLDRRTDMTFFNSWLDTPVELLDETDIKKGEQTNAQLIADHINLDYNGQDYTQDQLEYFSYYTDDLMQLDLNEMDQLIEFNLSTSGIRDSNENWRLKLSESALIIEHEAGDPMVFDMVPIFTRKDLNAAIPLTYEDLYIRLNETSVAYHLYIKSISGYKGVDNQYQIESVAGFLLVDK